MAISSLQGMESVVITGSRGFIGGHLVQLLEENNIPFIVFKGNLLDLASIKEFFKSNPVQQVIHLAGSFIGSFQQLVEKNVITTQHLLEAGVETGLQKIIYASTGAVYGEPVGDVSFETDRRQPNTLYGLSKKMAEDVIFHYHLVKNLKYVVLRFPNVYGEGNKSGVLCNFLTDIHSKGSITVAGDGEQARNFLHVSDACAAVMKAINYGENNVFNISTRERKSLNEIVQLLKQFYSFDIHRKAADNNLKNLLLDTSKAESLLQFKALVNDPSVYMQKFNLSK